MGRPAKGYKKELSPGVWKVQASATTGRTGRRRKLTRTVRGTEADANAALVRLQDELGRCPAAGDELTLDQWFWGHFMPEKRSSRTRATCAGYESDYRAHIAEDLGWMDLNDIDNLVVQRWVNGLPPQSAPSYVKTLRAVLNSAHFSHVMLEQPMGPGYHYSLPRGRDTRPGDVWTAAEVGECLTKLRGHRLFPVWAVMVGAGLSRSEALALDWEGLSWTDVLGVDGQPHHTAVVSVEGAYTAQDGMKDTKNDRRRRRVPLVPPFSDALWECRGKGPICQSVKSDGKPTGKRLTPRYVPGLWRSLFDKGKPLEGMRFVHLGRMRATYSTLMQQSGVDLSVINAMQGRSANSQVLYTNYLNPQMDTFVRASEGVGRVMREA